MPFVLLAIFLTFAAPVPLTDLPSTLEDVSVVDVSRSGRAARHRFPRPSRPVEPASTPTPPRPSSPEIPAPAAIDWTPRLFSRPPPL